MEYSYERINTHGTGMQATSRMIEAGKYCPRGTEIKAIIDSRYQNGSRFQRVRLWTDRGQILIEIVR